MYIVAVASSVINTTSVISDPGDLMDTYPVVVTCHIRPTSTAVYCEVLAENGDTTLTSTFTTVMYVCTCVSLSMDVMMYKGVQCVYTICSVSGG